MVEIKNKDVGDIFKGRCTECDEHTIHEVIEGDAVKCRSCDEVLMW